MRRLPPLLLLLSLASLAANPRHRPTASLPRRRTQLKLVVRPTMRLKPLDLRRLVKSRRKLLSPGTRDVSKKVQLNKKESCGVEPDFKPCVDVNSANERYAACCAAGDISADCLPYCKYNVSMAVLGAAVSSLVCPPSELGAILHCAAQGRDNKPCCEAKGVFKDTHSLCHAFCDPSGGALDSFGAHQLRCAARVEDILGCHQAGLQRKAPVAPPAASSRLSILRKRTRLLRSIRRSGLLGRARPDPIIPILRFGR